MEEEHRVAPRRRVLKAGSITFGGGAMDCTVRNISETGAALEAVTLLYIPDRFKLVVQRRSKSALSYRLAEGKAHWDCFRLKPEKGRGLRPRALDGHRRERERGHPAAAVVAGHVPESRSAVGCCDGRWLADWSQTEVKPGRPPERYRSSLCECG
jgi:hypothetical protein